MPDHSATPKIPSINVAPDAPSHFVNMYRVRADRYTFVVDFAYFPPMEAKELQEWGEQALPVATRILMPYDLVPQLIETLAKTYEASQVALDKVSAEKGPAPQPGSGPGANRVSSLRK